MAVTHMNSASTYPRGSISFIKMSSVFLEVRSGSKPLNFKSFWLCPKEGQAVQHIRGTEQSLAVRTKGSLSFATYWLEN